MTAQKSSQRQEWTPEQITRGAVAIAVLVVLLAVTGLGLYGYNPNQLPQPATDFIAPRISPATARGMVWALAVVLLVALLAVVAGRWVHRREVLVGTGALAGLIAAGLALYAYAGVGTGALAGDIPSSTARPLLWVVLAVLGVGAAVTAGRWMRRRRRRFAAGLVEALPRDTRASYDPDKHCEPSRWHQGRPRRVRLHLPEGFPATSTAAQAVLTKAMTDRMGAKLEANWHGEQVTFKVATTRPTDVARDREKDRVAAIAADLFSGEVGVLGIKQWGGPDGNTPYAFSLSYPAAARDTNEGFRRRVEITLGEKVGPRFQAEWEPTRDQVTLTPRPPMPENISHPGTGIYRKRDWNMLPIGQDENGELVCWNAKLQSHALGNGATNSGKTVTARSVIVGALLLGWEVYLNDPKQIELIGFAHDWGVKSIAATPNDMADLIARVRALMDDRYTEIREKIDQRIDPEVDKNYRPILVVIDEFAELVEVLGKVDEVWAMLRLARACNIHLLIMTQRPDANDFKRGSRDNLTWRYSMNALSEQGAKMMWENTDWGRYIPPVKGRGMAGVYGREPAEVQCFWVPDPAFPRGESDTALRDELRTACQRTQADVPASVAGADYDLPPVQPSPEGHLDRIITDPGELLTVILDGNPVETASTLAETLVTDDRIIIDNRAWDVTTVTPAGPDQVTIELRATASDDTTTITRAITDQVLSVVTTGKAATTDTDTADESATATEEQADSAPAESEDYLQADDDGGETAAPATNADGELPPPLPMFVDDDEEDLFVVPDDEPRPPATAAPPRVATTTPPAPATSKSAPDIAELVETLRRAWHSIPDPDARTALLASAPNTPEVRALKAELDSSTTVSDSSPPPAAPHDPAARGDDASTAATKQNPSTEPTVTPPPAAAPTPERQPAREQPGEPGRDQRRAGQLVVGDRIKWRNKKGQSVAYTVQHVETSEQTVHLTLKPARGRERVVDIPTGESVTLVEQAA